MSLSVYDQEMGVPREHPFPGMKLLASEFKPCSSRFCLEEWQHIWNSHRNPLLKNRRISATVWPMDIMVHFLFCLITHTPHTHTHTQPFYGPFSGTTWVIRCQKKYSQSVLKVWWKIWWKFFLLSLQWWNIAQCTQQ